MTTSQRLAFLSGLSGVSAGSHLLAIRRSGVTAGQMLVSRSALSSASALQHLLNDEAVDLPDSLVNRGFMLNMGTFMGRM